MNIEDIVRIIHHYANNFIEKDVKNIERELQRKALSETAEFVELNMMDVQSFSNKFELLEHAINNSNKDGVFLEFGVFEGETINFISSKVNNKVYGTSVALI